MAAGKEKKGKIVVDKVFKEKHCLDFIVMYSLLFLARLCTFWQAADV